MSSSRDKSRRSSKKISPENSSVSQIFSWGVTQLKFLGAREAQAEAGILAEEILGLKRHEILLKSNDSVAPSAAREFVRLVQRRKTRMPLAYLLRKAYFWNEVLVVGPGCLIPRPETELLVEKFIEFSGYKTDRSFDLLDLCCGSGAIGIALLRHFENARAVFSDLSPAALDCTQNNLKRYALVKRSKPVRSNLFQKINGEFDAIVCNPPYLTMKEWRTAQPEVRFEPEQALLGGKDGFDFYRAVSNQAAEYLNPGGFLMFEVGRGQSRQVKKFLSEKFTGIEIFKDYNRIERVVKARKK